VQHSWSAVSVLAAALLAITSAACGGSPTTPAPPSPPAPPPVNALPSIDNITVQGRRLRQPPRFADLRETVEVSANVRDAETPAEELAYQWSATAGTFSGSGRTVTWTAPEAATTPTSVTITLKLVESYGHPGGPKLFSQEVSGTQTVALHDSGREVGDMSRQFLTDFSTTSIKDWQVVMRNFKRSVCPVPGEFDDERQSVENHYTNFTMHNYEIGPPTVSVNFGGACAAANAVIPGDACAAARVMWDSTGPDGRGSTTGVDHLTAVYSSADTRWWLCSSRYAADTTAAHGFYGR